MPCDIYVQIHQHGLTFYEIGVEYIMGVWNKVNALIKKSILRLIFFHFLKEKKNLTVQIVYYLIGNLEKPVIHFY